MKKPDRKKVFAMTRRRERSAAKARKRDASGARCVRSGQPQPENLARVQRDWEFERKRERERERKGPGPMRRAFRRAMRWATRRTE